MSETNVTTVDILEAAEMMLETGNPSYNAQFNHPLLSTISKMLMAEEEGREFHPGEVSDGYHTFQDLYNYRRAYNALLFNAWSDAGLYGVHKSMKHHDGEDCFGGGWFIVMAHLPTGQISNHYSMKHWDEFWVPARAVADEWDGHSPLEALDRMNKMLQR